MGLTIDGLTSAKDDNDLFDLLSTELNERFPADLQENRDQFLTELAASPRGLRAMAGIFDLDVSLSLDDLAWHFGNHNDERFFNETALGLRELDACEAADIFLAAWEIV